MSRRTQPVAECNWRPSSSRFCALLHVRLHGFNQLFSNTPRFRILRRVDDVQPDMVFDHLSHETVYGSSRADDDMQDSGTPLLILDGALERVDLEDGPSLL